MKSIYFLSFNWRSFWAVAVKTEDLDAQSQSAGGKRQTDVEFADISHTFPQCDISDNKCTTQPFHPKPYFRIWLFGAAGSERVRSSVRPCAWNRVREPKVADRSEGDAAFCFARGRFQQPLRCTVSLITNPFHWAETASCREQGIHYLNIHLNLSSTIITSFCRVNHELRSAHCIVVARFYGVSKLTALFLTVKWSLQDESLNVYLPLRKDPIRCFFPPQTVFLCALCPARIRCIPFQSHIAPKKSRRSSVGNKPGK